MPIVTSTEIRLTTPGTATRVMAIGMTTAM